MTNVHEEHFFHFFSCAVRCFSPLCDVWVVTSLLTKIEVVVGVTSYRLVVTDIAHKLSSSETSVNRYDITS